MNPPRFDPLADAVVGLRAGVQSLVAALASAAPVTEQPPRGDSDAETLALLGVVSVCQKLQCLFDAVPELSNEPVVPSGANPQRSLLR